MVVFDLEDPPPSVVVMSVKYFVATSTNLS